MQAKILIVDDEPAIRHVLQRQLRRLGHLTLETDTGQTALQMMADQEIDVALVDLNLHAPDGMDGLALITQAAARSPRTRCVMVTGSGQPDDAWQALSVGAFDYLYKPDIDGDVLDDLIERAMAWKLATQDPQFVSMIGRSEAMQNLQKRIRRIAPLPINALIVGESGSGKERVARALHALAPQGPFVAINCAALPQGVLESELFGHEKGSFTGAHAARKGAFERAAGGVLLLDEIGDMPIHVQAHLLRVVEQRAFSRVGGNTERPVRCRVLAATHVHLAAQVEDGQFRRDLYHRLRQAQLRVPPLRERIEDVPLLTWFFIHRFNREFGYHVHRVTPDAMQLLRSRSWTNNNVRQLENAIRGAMIEADEPILRAQHFDRDYLGPSSATTDPNADDEPALTTPRYPFAWLERPLSEVKKLGDEALRRWYVTSQMDRYERVADAARASGMHPSNFSRELRRLDR